MGQRRWGLYWVWLGAGVFQMGVAVVVLLAAQPEAASPAVGWLFAGLWGSALILIEILKALRLRRAKPADIVQAGLLDAALLGFALVLAGLVQSTLWPGLFVFFGVGHYLWGFLRLRSRL